MKKILLILAVTIFMTSIKTEAFDFVSVLNFLNRASEEQAAQTQPASLSDLEKQMTAIDKSVQTAFIETVSEISGWKETWNIKSQLKQDRNDILTSTISSYTNSYLANNKQAITNKIKKMSAKEKTALINDLAKLKESEQNYLLLATNGVKSATNAIRTAQNMAEAATAIANMNTMAAKLRNRATTLVTFVNQIRTIATAAGVSVN